MDITSYFQSRVRFLTPATIALAVMVGPEGNFIGSCCPVARIFMLVPPISITSTFIIEVPRHVGEDNRGEVGSRLPAKVRYHETVRVGNCPLSSTTRPSRFSIAA